MMDKNSRNFSFSAQLGILLGLVGTGLVIGTLASGGIWMLSTGRPILSMESDMMNPQYYSVIMWMQVISTFFMFFLPVYFFALICYFNPWKFIGFNENINLKQVLIVAGLLLLTFPLSGALAEINKVIPIPNNWAVKFKNMEKAREEQESALININSFSRYFFSMIVIGLLPAIFEEVCFRGGLQNIFTRWFKNPWVAIIVTAIIFSAFHVSYYGFLVRFALGIVLGFVFYYSGNLWLPVLLHFLFNGLQVTAMYVTTMQGSKNTKDIEDNFPLWAGAVALIIIVYLFIHFKKISIAQQEKFVFEHPDDPDDFHNWITKES
ncbi:MAG: type II CAAX endopeptidase family protein [Ginsengibacter sp.]